MRPIDADALGIGKAKRDAFVNPAYADGWNSAIDVINAAETLDVVPVVHSRWIPADLDKDYVTCENCKRLKLDGRMAWNKEMQAEWGMNWCPNCGAKMDKHVREGRKNNDRTTEAVQ